MLLNKTPLHPLILLVVFHLREVVVVVEVEAEVEARSVGAGEGDREIDLDIAAEKKRARSLGDQILEMQAKKAKME